MSQELFNILSIILQMIIAIGAIFFALWQTLINSRLKKIQDYVSISLVPTKDTFTNEFQLQIKNVGKINVYLYKYEIGEQTHSFENARLIASGSDTFYVVNVPINNLNKELPVKTYLRDEFNNKYLTTGAIIIDAITLVNEGAQQLQSPSVRLSLRAWSYRTEKFNWCI